MLVAAIVAATVAALPLPRDFTIAPESDHRLMAFARDGTVYAIAEPIDARETSRARPRALRWSTPGRRATFTPVPERDDALALSAPRVVAIVPALAGAYVSIARTHDGAYLGTSVRTDRWIGETARAWDIPPCVTTESSGLTNGIRVVASDGNVIGVTIDPSWDSTGIDLGDMASVERNLPRALIVDSERCLTLGTGVVTGMRGSSVVGYLGELDGRPAPVAVNQMAQHMEAIRWRAGHEQPLGPGVALAITAGGVVVGASALPGHVGESATGNFFGPPGTYAFATPHAVLWTSAGRRTALVHGDRQSVAWDIDPRQTVVGMLQSVDGRHHAFRRTRDGRVERLDDLAHPAGWRFECAYAIDANGTIAGIGTHDGIATGFLWRERSR